MKYFLLEHELRTIKINKESIFKIYEQGKLDIFLKKKHEIFQLNIKDHKYDCKPSIHIQIEK